MNSSIFYSKFRFLWLSWIIQGKKDQEYGYHQEIIFKGAKVLILGITLDQFKTLDIRALAEREDCVLYDIKGALPAGDADGRL